jgi:hypothetical protein
VEEAPRVAEEDRLLLRLVGREELERTQRAVAEGREQLLLRPRKRSALLAQPPEGRLELR